MDHEAPGLVISILRYWRSSVLIVVVCAALGYGVSLLLPEKYVATAQVALLDPRRDEIFQGAGSLPRDLEVYTERQATVVTSNTVLGSVEGHSAGELRSKVTADGSNPGQLLISASGSTGQEAQELANAVADAYGEQVNTSTRELAEDDLAALDRVRVEAEDVVRDRADALDETPNDPVLEAELRAAQDTLADVNEQISRIRTNADAFGDGVDFSDPAGRPTVPVEPKPLRNAAVGGLIGVLLAGALAWFRADRHRVADGSGAPAGVLGAPLLGTVPDMAKGDELRALTDGASVAGEAFQFAAASLQYVFKWGVLLVTSPQRGDGKTVSAASIAAAAARDGTRVLLVDADVRALGLTGRILGPEQAERHVGLTDLASGTARTEEAVRLVALAEDVTLPFLPGGTVRHNLGSLFRTAGMGAAVRLLRESYDLVVVDCPALLPVADVASLSAHADGILLTIKRSTPIDLLEEVRSRLELVPAPLVGYVFTRAGDPLTYGPKASAGLGARRSRGRRRSTNGHFPVDGNGARSAEREAGGSSSVQLP
jgi:Mrp family chromosome partitioning ATPase/capsular polysaccharide biosynthesis protein